MAVAGGTGFVGGAIARELASRGNRVVVLSHRKRAQGPDAAAPVEVRPADVTRPESLAAALAGVEALVISLGFPNSPVEAPRRGRTFETVDAAGTEALVAAAKLAGVRRLIYMSGAGAAPDAPKHWFRAKWRAEEAVRASRRSRTRSSGPAGSTDPATTHSTVSWAWRGGCRSCRRSGTDVSFSRPCSWTTSRRSRPMPSRHPAAANATLEVGGPETLTMDQVIRTALRVQGRRRMILHAPVILMKIATAPLTLLPVPPMRPSAIDFVVQAAPVDTAGSPRRSRGGSGLSTRRWRRTCAGVGQWPGGATCVAGGPQPRSR